MDKTKKQKIIGYAEKINNQPELPNASTKMSILSSANISKAPKKSTPATKNVAKPKKITKNAQKEDVKVAKSVDLKFIFSEETATYYINEKFGQEMFDGITSNMWKTRLESNSL